MADEHGMRDTWESYQKALIRRFRDDKEDSRTNEKLRALKYEGDIQSLLTQFEDHNLKARLNHTLTKEWVKEKVPKAILNSIYTRNLGLPKDPTQLIKECRRVGVAMEEADAVKGFGKHANERKKEEPKKDVPDSFRKRRHAFCGACSDC